MPSRRLLTGIDSKKIPSVGLQLLILFLILLYRKRARKNRKFFFFDALRKNDNRKKKAAVCLSHIRQLPLPYEISGPVHPVGGRKAHRGGTADRFRAAGAVAVVAVASAYAKILVAVGTTTTLYVQIIRNDCSLIGKAIVVNQAVVIVRNIRSINDASESRSIAAVDVKPSSPRVAQNHRTLVVCRNLNIDHIETWIKIHIDRGIGITADGRIKVDVDVAVPIFIRVYRDILGEIA